MELTCKNRKKPMPMPCIWMQAGVVKKKLCTTDFHCAACHFDKTMQKAAAENEKCKEQGLSVGGKQGQIIFWKEKLKELPTWKRPCLHHMKSRIEFRTCTNDYRCGNCEFDQYFNDQYTVHAVVRPVSVLDIQGFKIPQGYYLHVGHTWVKIEEGSEVRIGLDDFALRMLGPLDEINAPLLGKEIRQGHGDISLNRGQHKATILSPVSGVITGINAGLRKTGSKANQDPYADGWVVRAHTSGLREELKNLMIGEEAGMFIKKEVDTLYTIIEDEVPLAADGGQLGSDIFGNLPETSWRRLTKTFLHTQ